VFKKYAIETNGDDKPPKLPLPLKARGPRLIYPFLHQPHSPPQKTARSVLALSHNYATKSPLVTMGRPKLPIPLRLSPPHLGLTHPSLDRSHSLSQKASGSNQPFIHSTFRTDRPTDRHRPTARFHERLRSLY